MELHNSVIQKRNIIIPKTARYFLHGNVNSNTKYIWLIFHGYGQLANYFLEKFTFLNPHEHIVIAPEGLHRFYWEKFTGRVVASWMTKEDRIDDITDYQHFIEAVVKESIIPNITENVQFITLGFSQGAATMARWLSITSTVPKKIIWYAGVTPTDLNWELSAQKLKKAENYWIVGSEDEFIKEEDVKNYEALFTEKDISLKTIRFEGGHEIKRDVFKEIIM